MSQELHFAIATGTRADWGLLLPLADALRNAGAKISVLATNMHLQPQFGNTISEIIADGFEPVKIEASGSPYELCAQTCSGFGKWLGENKPRAIIVLGDRAEMLGVASAALLSGIPLIHIAGGTISEGAFDDSIRHAISKMATLHLVETDRCRQRLIQMGEQPENVISTGAIGVYNVLQTPLMTRMELEQSLQATLPKEIILATLHAATLDGVSPLEMMNQFIGGLQIILNERPDSGVLFTYPNNDVDAAPLIDAIEKFKSKNPQRVVTIPSLGRVRYMSALALSACVAGNSSSGIVEVPSMGIGVLDVGIRQKGREASESVVHVDCSADAVANGLRTILSPQFRKMARECKNPYHKENTPELITQAILNHSFSPFPSKVFFDTPEK